MAKKDRAGKDKSAGRTEAVRSAVDQAFSASAAQGAAAAEQGRERAQDIVDQLAQAAGRVREVLDELRPPTGDELKDLRQTVQSLERRVATLESRLDAQPAAKPAARKTAKTAKTPGSGARGRSSASTAKRRGSSSGGGNPTGKS